MENSINNVSPNILSKLEDEDKGNKSCWDKIKNRYQNKIPIILTNGKNCDIEWNKNKLLYPKNFKVSQLIKYIDSKINISSDKSIVLTIKNKILKLNDTIEVLHNKYKSEDDFLYINYEFLETFGILC